MKKHLPTCAGGNLTKPFDTERDKIQKGKFIHLSFSNYIQLLYAQVLSHVDDFAHRISPGSCMAMRVAPTLQATGLPCPQNAESLRIVELGNHADSRSRSIMEPFILLKDMLTV